jgi:2-(1,2-epoxy-1,2-dihydrophenyl)acetyl-CoA isomerase
MAVRVNVDEGVAVLTLDRSDVMNALDASLRRELTAALRAVEARCVVLTGAGRGFCSGQDLGEAGAGLDAQRMLAEEYVPLLQAIHDCPAPVIAAVNGVAAGAGASLALACDVVVAAECASFSMAFARLGLIPDAGATWILPRNLGLARAMGMALFADPIPARQAAECGLIWEAVPDEAFEATWRARAKVLAAGPTLAFRAARTAIRGAFETSLGDQLAIEAAHQGRLVRGADFAEGVAAFREKRPATYRGG